MSHHLSEPFVKVLTAISQKIFTDFLSLTTRDFLKSKVFRNFYFCLKISICKYSSICITPSFSISAMFIY